MKKILIACEESQELTAAFITLGYDAMSCDLNYPGAKGLPHYQGDMFDLDFSQFDLIIAHPPCTYIANCGNKHYARTQARKDAADFIWRIWNIPVAKLVIENPIGQVNTYLPEMPRPANYSAVSIRAHGTKSNMSLDKKSSTPQTDK